MSAALDYHRATLLWKCAGLSAEQLVTRSAEPSTMSLLGLVRHMAEVERGWWRMFVAQEQLGDIYLRDDAPDADFDETDPAGVEEDLATYRAEIAACRTTAARFGLDETRPHRRTGGPIDVRWVYLHMIEEYARHNGHADFLREQLDGTTGDFAPAARA